MAAPNSPDSPTSYAAPQRAGPAEALFTPDQGPSVPVTPRTPAAGWDKPYALTPDAQLAGKLHECRLSSSGGASPASSVASDTSASPSSAVSEGSDASRKAFSKFKRRGMDGPLDSLATLATVTSAAKSPVIVSEGGMARARPRCE